MSLGLVIPVAIVLVLAVVALFVVAISRASARTLAQRTAAIEAEVAGNAARGEKLLCPPTFARIRRGRMTSRAVVALTNERVVVSGLSRTDIPLAEVTGVRSQRSYNGEFWSGAAFVVLASRAGEVGIAIRAADAPRWLDAIQPSLAKGGAS